MRSNKEILEVFLSNQDEFYAGLCQWISTLKRREEITDQECRKIRQIVACNKPFLTSIGFQGGEGYYWKKGDIKPRIKFLKKYLK